MAGLSILIPTLNEARRLPLLLADLARWPHGAQVIVVDGGSRDRTTVVASLAGVARLSSPERGRGQQLIHGMAAAIHDWTLVLHADSRLPPRWCSAVQRVIENPQAKRDAWFFDFRVEERGPMLWLLERSVGLRSRLGQRPYGDQGLLIHRTLYAASGGYQPDPLDGGPGPGGEDCASPQAAATSLSAGHQQPTLAGAGGDQQGLVQLEAATPLAARHCR